MEMSEINRGMFVRYENQKWMGIVTGFSTYPNEVLVQFEGETSIESIDAGFLKPF